MGLLKLYLVAGGLEMVAGHNSKGRQINHVAVIFLSGESLDWNFKSISSLTAQRGARGEDETVVGVYTVYSRRR